MQALTYTTLCLVLKCVRHSDTNTKSQYIYHMGNLDLKDSVFRVYTKFTIISPDNIKDNLKQHVMKIQEYDLSSLVRLLVFGCIDPKRCDRYLIKDDFLGLLYDLDGKSSPLALSLLRDKKMYKIDLGYLLIGDSDENYLVHLSTFMLILLFYSSVHYKDIGYNMRIAIGRFLRYIEDGQNSYLMERFQELKEDIGVLRGLINESPKSGHEVKPSVFREVIQKMISQLKGRVESLSSRENEGKFMDYLNTLVGADYVSGDLQELMHSMFELFRAGYYPASISSVLPDTVLAVLPNKDVYGQLDYTLLLDAEYLKGLGFTNVVVPDNAEDSLVRVAFRGSYAGESILYQYATRWNYIEERIPGAWHLFRIIYNRLEKGEYNTKDYDFSNYRFPVMEQSESMLRTARIRWLNLFSSFILGHVINLIGTNSNQQLYKIAAPAINIRGTNDYLIPDNFYLLQEPVIVYEVYDDGNSKVIEPRTRNSVRWLRYKGDNIYTPTSASISDNALYESSYAIVVPTDEVTDVSFTSYAGHPEYWNEVVLANMDQQKNALDIKKLDRLSFQLCDESGNRVDIQLEASAAEENSEIEPCQINLDKPR